MSSGLTSASLNICNDLYADKDLAYVYRTRNHTG